MNKSKTEAIIIYDDGTINHGNLYGIKWSEGPFKTLGIWFSTNFNEMHELNINDKNRKIEALLNIWTCRSLNLKGKVP